MGDDLGVGLAGEVAALSLKGLLELQVVLDDAVVGDDHAAHPVGVSVGLRGAAVGGPPGVAEADGAVEGLGAEGLFEAGELALGAADADLAGVVGDGDAGGVIAPVFEPSQAVEEERGARGVSYKAYDSAHVRLVVVRVIVIALTGRASKSYSWSTVRQGSRGEGPGAWKVAGGCGEGVTGMWRFGGFTAVEFGVGPPSVEDIQFEG